MSPKCLHLSTRGRWVVKKAQNSVYVVIEWPLTTQFQALSNWLTLECGSKVVLMVREELSAYYAPSPFFYSCRQKLAISQIHSEIILQKVTFCRIIEHISYLKIYKYLLMINYKVMDFRVYHWGSLYFASKFDDLLLWLRCTCDDFSALLPLPDCRCNSPKLEARMLRVVVMEY